MFGIPPGSEIQEIHREMHSMGIPNRLQGPDHPQGFEHHGERLQVVREYLSREGRVLGPLDPAQYL